MSTLEKQSELNEGKGKKKQEPNVSSGDKIREWVSALIYMR